MKQQAKNNASKASNAKMMEAKMKAAKHVSKHGRSEPWSNGERCDPKEIAEPKCTTPPRTAHAQPHVHSPCAQPLDDGWLPHVKMLQLLAGFEGECKAAHRVRRGSWPRSGWLRGGGRRGGGRRASRRWRRGASRACWLFFSGLQRCHSSSVVSGPGVQHTRGVHTMLLDRNEFRHAKRGPLYFFTAAYDKSRSF